MQLYAYPVISFSTIQLDCPSCRGMSATIGFTGFVSAKRFNLGIGCYFGKINSNYYPSEQLTYSAEWLQVAFLLHFRSKLNNQIRKIEFELSDTLVSSINVDGTIFVVSAIKINHLLCR